LKQAFIMAFALLALAGCNTAPVQITDFRDQPVRRLHSQSISMDEVQIDVRMAAGKAGWNVIPEGSPGRLTAVKLAGETSATVEIAFDLNTYSIKYKDSTGLDFSNGCAAKASGSTPAGSRCISPTYNEWVTELNNAMSLKLQY
jgi:hypothetical protein